MPHRLVLALPAVAASLVLAACGGGSAKADRTAATTEATSAGVPSGSVTGDPTTAAAAPSGSVTTTSTAGPTSRAATSAPTTAARTTRTTAPAPATGQAVAAGFTPTGTYTFDQSGTTSFGDVPATAESAADAPQGSSQTSRATDSSGTTTTTVSHAADGLHLVELSTSSRTGTIDFQPKDVPVYLPANATDGTTWGFTTTSTDGKYTITASFRSGSRTTTTVGGQRVATLPVHADLHITGGGLDVTQAVDAQVDTARALITAQHVVTKGTYSHIGFDADVTQVLRSEQPH